MFYLNTDLCTKYMLSMPQHLTLKNTLLFKGYTLNKQPDVEVMKELQLLSTQKNYIIIFDNRL